MSMADRVRRSAADILEEIISASPPPFALLHRPQTNGSDVIDVIVGEAATMEKLGELAIEERSTNTASPAHGCLALVPYRQIAERGYACVDDSEPLIAIRIRASDVMPLDEVMERLPDEEIEVRDERYDLDDDQYADVASAIIRDEIGAGAGANFVLK